MAVAVSSPAFMSGDDFPADDGEWFPKDSRRAGVLLHQTSFPGPYSIGEEAFRFIDWLLDSGWSLWLFGRREITCLLMKKSPALLTMIGLSKHKRLLEQIQPEEDYEDGTAHTKIFLEACGDVIGDIPNCTLEEHLTSMQSKRAAYRKAKKVAEEMGYYIVTRGYYNDNTYKVYQPFFFWIERSYIGDISTCTLEEHKTTSRVVVQGRLCSYLLEQAKQG